MRNDLGLGEWPFDFDSAARQRFPDAVIRMFSQDEHTRRLVQRAQTVLAERFGFFAGFLQKQYGC